jgi:hypothetical protein
MLVTSLPATNLPVQISLLTGELLVLLFKPFELRTQLVDLARIPADRLFRLLSGLVRQCRLADDVEQLRLAFLRDNLALIAKIHDGAAERFDGVFIPASTQTALVGLFCSSAAA